jgi:hypothetical protein
MLRVCFFPLPQDGRRDEWAGADRTNGSHHPARASKATMLKTADRVLGVHGLVMRQFHALNEYEDCSQGTTRTLENSPLTIIAAARADANNAPGKLIA